jgi:hypothetical protein
MAIETEKQKQMVTEMATQMGLRMEILKDLLKLMETEKDLPKPKDFGLVIQKD